MLTYILRVADIYKAIADSTRRTILDELAQRDGQTLFEICARLVNKHDLNSSRQAISQHIDVLEEAGVVEIVREGRYKYHHFNSEPLAPLATRWLKTTQEDIDTDHHMDEGREPS